VKKRLLDAVLTVKKYKAEFNVTTFVAYPYRFEMDLAPLPLSVLETPPVCNPTIQKIV
jgi:hypothetical protein